MLVELLDTLVLPPPVPEDVQVDGLPPQTPHWHVIPPPQSVSSSLTTWSQPVSPHRSNLQGSSWRQFTGSGATHWPAGLQTDGPV